MANCLVIVVGATTEDVYQSAAKATTTTEPVVLATLSLSLVPLVWQVFV